MTRRRIRIISFFCGLLLAAAGFALLAQLRSTEAERRRAEDGRRALTDAVVCLENMTQALAAAVAGERPLPQLIELRHRADLACAALGAVQISGEGGEALRRFAACTAGFAGAMADDIACARRRTPDYAVLIRLRDAASALTETVLPAAMAADGGPDEAIIARHLADVGRLYYDGVGADVRAPAGYLSLLGRPDVGVEEAERLAAEIAGENARLHRITLTGEPARYGFTCRNLTVTLTAADGNLLALLYDRVGGTGDVGEAAARAAAEAAVARYAPEAMEEDSCTTAAGSYCFTFVPQRGGLRCLSERILIGIDAATGKLSLWDADGYYRYAVSERVLPDGLLTPERAAALIGRTEQPELCTAVRADGREILCYRFGGADPCWLNAVTGALEAIG